MSLTNSEERRIISPSLLLRRCKLQDDDTEMLPQSGGGFAFFSGKDNEDTEVQAHSIDDTAELPDINAFMHDTVFSVEQDITYIHTDKRI